LGKALFLSSIMNDNRHLLFIFSYFKGHGDGLHLAWSRDGFRWTALNHDKPFITPQAGKEKIMRDPFLFPGKDGLFHLVWTAEWHGNGIGYASSPDLIHWSSQQLLPVMEHEPNVRNCWAPEIFFDEDQNQHIIYWASSIPGRFPDTDHTGDDGLNHRMYCVTSPDLKTFSKTKLFFDAGINVIDATVVKDGDRYIMFMKDERLNPCQKNIRVAVSRQLFSGFEKVSAPITGSYWAEGPTAIKIEGKWMVYFDKYKINKIGGVRSSDLKSWEDVSDSLHFPEGAQHGSVVGIPFDRMKHLL
jgi:hypothetical protein